MPALRSPVDFVNAGMRLQTAGTGHEFGAQRRRTVDGDAGTDHSGGFAVIAAQLRNLDAVGVQVAMNATAHVGLMLGREDHGKTGSAACRTRSRRLYACTTQEQMKQTHDDSCPGAHAGSYAPRGSVLEKAGVCMQAC